MILGEAIKEGFMEYQDNPFLKYKIKKQPTQKNYLTEEELSQVENLDLNPETLIFHHRNMYIFSAYAAGIRISDLLKLTWSNFDGQRVILSTGHLVPICFKVHLGRRAAAGTACPQLPC